MYSGEGLNKINPSAQHFEHYRPQPGEQGGLSGKMVKSILIDHAQNLWVGIFNGGLDVKKTGNERFSSISFTQKGKRKTHPLMFRLSMKIGNRKFGSELMDRDYINILL